jgi:predicted outer membrane repeat protein
MSCVFERNSASEGGAGIYMSESSQVRTAKSIAILGVEPPMSDSQC